MGRGSGCDWTELDFTAQGNGEKDEGGFFPGAYRAVVKEIICFAKELGVNPSLMESLSHIERDPASYMRIYSRSNRTHYKAVPGYIMEPPMCRPCDCAFCSSNTFLGCDCSHTSETHSMHGKSRGISLIASCLLHAIRANASSLYQHVARVLQNAHALVCRCDEHKLPNHVFRMTVEQKDAIRKRKGVASLQRLREMDTQELETHIKLRWTPSR